MEPKDFGKEIRKLRNQKDITQTELGNRTGFTKSYLSIIENGRQGIPQPKTLKKLSQGLNVSYGHLMNLAGYADKDDALTLDQAQKIIDSANWDESLESIDNENRSKEFEQATKLMNLYFRGVTTWSVNKFLNEVETVAIREHFYNLLLNYKELVEGYVNSKLRWNNVKEDFIRLNEGKFSEDIVSYKDKEESARSLFMQQELTPQIEAAQNFMTGFPLWLTINSSSYSGLGASLSKRLEDENNEI